MTVIAAPTANPATTAENTIERKMFMTTRLVAREGVRVPHVMSCVVQNVDVREANHADDEETERHGE
jgi:hypothetical protein